MTNPTTNPLNRPVKSWDETIARAKARGDMPADWKAPAAAGVQAATKPAAASPAKPPMLGPELRVVEILLADVEIDANQVRRYLPLDLRADVAAQRLKPDEVLAALAKRTDAVSMRYMADIRALAASILADGQLVSVILTKAPARSSARWMLVDGERRFWALHLLEREHKLDKPRRIRAEMALESLSADQIKRLQWRANFDRRGLSTMDLIDLIAARKAYWDGRIAVNRAQCEKDIAATADDLNKCGLAVIGTQKDLRTLTGQDMRPVTVMQYLTVASKLGDAAKSFARTHDLGIRALRQVATWAADKQVAELSKRHVPAVLEEADLTMAHAASSVSRAGGGRPSKGAQICGLASRFNASVAKLDAASLKKLSVTELQNMTQALRDVLSTAKEQQALCERILHLRSRP